ncbi:MAG: class III signal peptide-containing protein [Candidatus Diapherotrites archaeon]|nr:class III signal peptide-containing protein [Candidatus Diapherotrites archaeon]
MNKKGQGALEYLLLIGGAILVAVIVITIITSVGSASGKQTEYNAIKALCAGFKTQAACGNSEVVVGSTSCDCVWPITTNACEVEAQSLCTPPNAD